MGSTIQLFCENICSQRGCTYLVSENIPAEILRDKNCEQGWYSETHEFLADPYALNGTKHSAVADIKPENMTTHKCLDGVYHLVACYPSNVKYIHTYHVFETQTPTAKPSASDLKVGLGLGFWLAMMLVLVLVLVCFMSLFIVKKQKKHSCRAIHDPEMVERQQFCPEPDQSAANSNHCNMDRDEPNKISAHNCNGGPPNTPRDSNGGPPNTPRDSNGGPPNTPHNCNGGPPNTPRDSNGGPPSTGHDCNGGPPSTGHDCNGGPSNTPRDTPCDCNGGPPSNGHDCNGGPSNTPRDCNGGPSNTPRDCNSGPPDTPRDCNG